jgi:nitric oxide reductase subunit C
MRTILLLVLIGLVSLAACGESTPTPPSPVPRQQLPAQPGDASRGQALFQQPLIGTNNAPGCANCHSLTPGVVLVGPSLAGIGSRATTIIARADYTGHAKSAVDYVREAILQPNAYVAPGFQPDVMRKTYATDLSAQELADLVAFLVTQ